MSQKVLRDNLITLAKTYAKAKGVALTTLSKQMHGKHTFLADYAADRVSPRIDTYYQMLNFLRRNWPPGKKMPPLKPITELGKKVDAA